ncbi:MAG: hypothetical protein JWP85_2129 [Rhodoglobus sp.]|nr:hypothetical protein [Rhodoglobus sp.]
MAKITAPVEGFNGISAGTQFTDGVGETDDENAIAYFERQGYTVGEVAAPAVTEPPVPAASKTPEEEEAEKVAAAAKVAAEEAAALAAFEKLGKDELITLAGNEGVDIASAKNNDERRAAITAARAAKP